MGVRAKTVEHLLEWVVARGGLAHREEILRAGFPVGILRAAVRSGEATLIRRAWFAHPSAPEDLRTAALSGGRVSCVSLARRRGWWMPRTADSSLHLHILPGSAPVRPASSQEVTTHWTKPIAPAGRALVASVEDALLHIATCLDRDAALVLWESAARIEGLAPEALRAVRWTSRAARELAMAVTGLSDSGLETIVVLPLERWGLPVLQQVKLAGRFVDMLVGERLVLQIDGYAFHSSSAQRTSDIAHDAELRLRGYTVIRLSYAQIIHDWPSVENLLRRAVTAGLHLAR